MRLCRYSAFECAFPHLKCGACEVYRRFRESAKDTLAPRGGVFPALPDPGPYVRIVDVAGRKGIEIGIGGTF